MTIYELFIIALGLAMDAFAVSVGKGLAVDSVRPRHALLAAVWFGGFQGLMPIIGYFVGRSFASFVGNIDHWIAFALLVLIGVNMIREAMSGDEERHNNDFGVRTMLLMAVATSIDALTVGVSMAFLDVNIWIAALAIGIVTFIMSFAGVYLGRGFGAKIGSKAGIVGGVVLIAIGIKILVEHLGII